MGKCRPEWLNLYADGETTAAQTEELQQHLACCQACQQALAKIVSLKHLLGQLPQVSAPAQLRPLVAKALRGACTSVQPLLGTYLDGELAGAHKEALQLHLACCADCRTELLTQQRLRVLVGNLGEVESPAEVRYRVAAMVERKRQTTRPIFAGWRKVGAWGAVATAAIALAFVFPVLRNAPESGTAPVLRVPSATTRREAPAEKPTVAVVSPAVTEGNPVIAPVVEKPRPQTKRRDGVFMASWSNSRHSRTKIHNAFVRNNPIIGDHHNEAVISRPKPEPTLIHNTNVVPESNETLNARMKMQRAWERYQVAEAESMLAQVPTPSRTEKIRHEDTPGPVLHGPSGIPAMPPVKTASATAAV
jgi:anti-sigma factor RsiW